MLDFELNTQVALFADEKTLEAAKRRSYQSGVLEGKDMAKVFAWMRPNDLIWNYWVNNYLLGRQPPAFDILYWNNDNTRLPAAFHGELLDLFKHNPLTRPGALEVSGTAVDLGKVAIDSFHVAGITDHITPWDAVYRSALLAGRPAPLHPVQQRAHPEHPQPSRKPQGLLLRERQAEQRSTRLVLRRQARRGQLVAGLAGLAAGALGRAGRP